VNEQTARRQRLDHARQDRVKSWRLHPVVEALQALRGVPFTVAVTMVAEIGALTRVETPRELMKFLGLSPSDYSSGEQRRQGSLTKAGNTHARRALVEGAWASRDPAKVSRHLHLSLATQPKVIQDLSWNAQVRRCQRDRRLVSRGNHPTVVTVAIARERSGCMWAIAQQVPVTPSRQDAGRFNLSLRRVPRCIGKRRSPGVGSPSAAGRGLSKDPRAESEAGTRRIQGRWSPTHGSPQAQPSDLTGPASSDGPRTKKS
jgi:transposase